MRTIQNLLLVVGTTSLGISAFVLALFSYAAASGLGSHGPSDLGAAGLGFLLFTGSAMLGGITGLVAGVWWVWKHQRGLWTRSIWSGVTLGVVTAFALHFANKLPRVPTVVEYFEPAPAAAVLAAAFGMLGGVIAKLAESRGSRRHRDERRERKLPL
jgi:hypothetical protein